MIVNSVWVVFGATWDNYPFILLNLVLSCLAAIQAPVILMSQNRQSKKDRLRFDYDYSVNRKAERKIEDIAAYYECPKCGVIYAKIESLLQQKTAPKIEETPSANAEVNEAYQFSFPVVSPLLSLLSLSFLLPKRLHLQAAPEDLSPATLAHRMWAAIATFLYLLLFILECYKTLSLDSIVQLELRSSRLISEVLASISEYFLILLIPFFILSRKVSCL